MKEKFDIEGSKKLKLILELKAHPTKEQEVLAVEEVVKLVKKHGVEKQTEYISFSPNICSEIRKQLPKSIIASLSSDLDPDAVKELNANGVDYHYKLMLNNPDWMAKCKKNKLFVNVWTVNNPDDIEEMIKLGVDYITTDEPEKATEIIKKNK